MRLIPLFIVCLVLTTTTEAGFRIANWNLQNRPGTNADPDRDDEAFQEVVSSIGRIDILAAQETDIQSAVRTASMLGDLFDTSFDYAIGSSGNKKNGLFWDTATVTEVATTELTEELLRPVIRGNFIVAGQELVIYSLHLKAGEMLDDPTTREAESNVIRSDADTLGEVNVIYAGDFNERGSFGVWDVITHEGPGRAFDAYDPNGIPGTKWTDNQEFVDVFTNTGQTRQRFDLQFVSDELLDLRGLNLIRDSYEVFPETISDHLPVVVEYGLVGDANGDNRVTFPDFLILAESFGRSDAPNWNDGDFDGSGVVDFLDFIALANNFEPSAVAIPEPSAILMAVVLLGCLPRCSTD